MKDRCRVIEPAGVSSLGEPENDRHAVARQGRQHAIETTIRHGNREVGGAPSVVGQTAKHSEANGAARPTDWRCDRATWTR